MAACCGADGTAGSPYGTPDWFNVKNYGAIGDGVVDDTAAINAAIVAANLVGTGTLYFPRGSYVVTSVLTTITSAVIIGDGPYHSQLVPSPGIGPFVIRRQFGGTIENIGINYKVAATSAAGAAIDFRGTSSSLLAHFVYIRNVAITNPYIGINLVETTLSSLHKVVVYGLSLYGVQMINTTLPDSGDHSVFDCVFWGDGGAGRNGIQWNSPGGLKVVETKFGILARGINNILQTGAVTAQLIAVANSFDTMSGYAIWLQRSGATGTFNQVLISSNIFASCFYAVGIPNDANGIWLTNVSITGNNFTSNGLAGAGFVSIDSVRGLLVAQNACLANATTDRLYQIGSIAQVGILGPNMKAPNAAGWSANSDISAPAGTFTVIAPT
jgi:pectate lyase-like protein